MRKMNFDGPWRGLYNEAFPNKQYKTLSKSLKKKSKKNYYPDLIDSGKYNNNKT